MPFSCIFLLGISVGTSKPFRSSERSHFIFLCLLSWKEVTYSWNKWWIGGRCYFCQWLTEESPKNGTRPPAHTQEWYVIRLDLSLSTKPWVIEISSWIWSSKPKKNFHHKTKDCCRGAALRIKGNFRDGTSIVGPSFPHSHKTPIRIPWVVWQWYVRSLREGSSHVPGDGFRTSESSKVLATWKKYLKKKAAQGISSAENGEFSQQVPEIQWSNGRGRVS